MPKLNVRVLKGSSMPTEILTMCDGYKPLRDANKLLKAHGLVLKWRKGDCGGDQVLLRLEKVEAPKRSKKKCSWGTPGCEVDHTPMPDRGMTRCEVPRA